MLPVPSHYTPCFGLARDLQDQGYEVIFLGNEAVQPLVAANGFACRSFPYLSTYFVRTARAVLGSLLVNLLDKGAGRRRFREFTSSVRAAVELFNGLAPDVIYLDEHLSHYYFYLARTAPRLYLINTKLSTAKATGIPPLNAGFVSRNTRLGAWYSELLWGALMARKWWDRTRNRIAFLGRDDEYFQERLVRKAGLPVRIVRQTAMRDYHGLAGVPSIQLVSDALDYPWKPRPADQITRHYWNRSQEQPLPDALRRVVSTGQRIVFCGMGTLTAANSRQHLAFLGRVVDAFAGRPDVQLVISTGNEALTAQLAAGAANVHLVSYLPQQAFLPYCHAMITRGGLNSVKECIDAGVPVLGVRNPGDAHTDTRGNVARIVYHRIGRACSIGAPAPVIAAHVDSLLGDPGYKTNLAALKRRMELTGTDDILPGLPAPAALAEACP